MTRSRRHDRRWLGDVLGGSVHGLKRLSGGAARETVATDGAVRPECGRVNAAARRELLRGDRLIGDLVSHAQLGDDMKGSACDGGVGQGPDEFVRLLSCHAAIVAAGRPPRYADDPGPRP